MISLFKVQTISNIYFLVNNKKFQSTSRLFSDIAEPVDFDDNIEEDINSHESMENSPASTLFKKTLLTYSAFDNEIQEDEVLTSSIKESNRSLRVVKKNFLNARFSVLSQGIPGGSSLTCLRLHIRIVKHNVFCLLESLNSGKTLFATNGGTFKQNISKKSVKHFLKFTLKNFFQRVRSLIMKDAVSLVISIKGSRFMKRTIYRSIFSGILKKIPGKHVIDFHPLKIFNGCRSKKAIRKKKRFFRVFR